MWQTKVDRNQLGTDFVGHRLLYLKSGSAQVTRVDLSPVSWDLPMENKHFVDGLRRVLCLAIVPSLA